jgi:hypothetical protein
MSKITRILPFVALAMQGVESSYTGVKIAKPKNKKKDAATKKRRKANKAARKHRRRR